MKKIIKGKIIDTEAGETIAEMVSARSHSNNPIAWEHIELIDGVYYLHIIGGNDIFSPEDNLIEIGAGCRDSLLPFIEEHDQWSRNVELIEHIEEVLG